MSVKMKLFCGFLALGVVMSAQNAGAAQDGSIFSGETCTNCKAAQTAKKVTIVDGTKNRRCKSCPTPEFKTKNYAFAAPRYKQEKRACCDMATFALTNVDFKLNENANPYAKEVGKYRFRIYGCRRIAKKAILDQGRIMQNYMAFHDVFAKSADRCYKVMDIPNVCLSNPGVQLPEYVLTAEINNLYMNVCDEYDWEQARQANKRDGSAEMTVTWRLMNLSQTKVYWKGVTTGYAEVEDGIYEGETKLAELAFGDAAARLSSLPGFEAQLKNHLNPQEWASEKAALIALDNQRNPAKCGAPMPMQTPCGQPACPLMMQQPVVVQQPVIMQQPICPCAMMQPCVCTQPVCTCPQVACPCAMPVKTEPKVEEFVDVKTKKKIIEQKIITKTRIETPAPVCRQVCQPVCPQPACQVQCTKTCQQPKCRRICTEVCDESTGQCTNNCREDCSKPVEPKVEVVTYVPKEEPKVEEKSEVVVENVKVEPQVEEKSGVVETHKVIENCIDENGNVVADPSCAEWYDLIKIDNMLCVVDRDPYEELSPENMLKVRGSVVDITNALGKKGTGLLVSDSFILTSASLVNKLQNTYDVKTISGQNLKAKAVRYNPNKNIALLHLDTPATYTPLSLNTKLPAIDQEGFISLGDNTQNYLDDNGKIYGYRYSDALGTEVVVDALVNKVNPGSVLVDKLGSISGMSSAAQQTENGMDVFLPTDTVLKSVGLTICERIYKPVTEKIIQETKAPEAMPAPARK